ncbi:hypothetical protein AKJ09_09366 [Labilithrix luteola]|uniref:Phosphatidic acid phosphatase type 2/haloperoxidase domain-containing protein n=1 Tax=Labilithrix luteola TaxID=1391654 RepID=A0A0K1QAF7_9BACT|nr:hypothetical protein AKJ09_09366 [Labilithrix luteola]
MPACVAESEPNNEIVGVTESAATFTATSSHPATYARQWMTNLANSCKKDVCAPPVAARTYSYGAIAIYESVVHGMPGYRSLAGQIRGLDSLPQPDASLTYDWPTVLAQTMHRVTNDGGYVYPNRLFFEFTAFTDAALKSLGPTQIAFRRTEGVPDAVINDSVAYANRLADALIAWVNADGYNEVRFKGWVAPQGPDKWVSTGFSDTDKVANPQEPYFGTLRPLVLTSPDECATDLAPPQFSTDPSSEWYQSAKEVYDTDRSLTAEEREIARFWADVPGDTPSPAGHWLALITKNVRAGNLGDAAAGYVQAGLGFYESFLAIWETKYHYNTIRPESYIRRYIDPTWRPTWATPQFPSWVSGHSGLSGASGVLFTAAFGNGPVVDDTKLRRGFGARSYANYHAAADEAAVSRLYGGIHYRFDNDDGLALGRCVGNKILERVHLR